MALLPRYGATCRLLLVCGSSTATEDGGLMCEQKVLQSPRLAAMPDAYSTEITRHKVPLEIVQALLPIALDLAARNSKVGSVHIKKSNRGGWHSTAEELLTAIRAPGAPEVAAQLPAVILGAVAAHLDCIAGGEKRTIRNCNGAPTGTKLAGEIRLQLLGVWANVNDYGHGNVAHTHPGLLSGAFYLDPADLEGATICLSDPRIARRGPAPQLCSSNVEGRIGEIVGVALQGLRAGDVVVFPSWLEHHVPPHTRGRPRVSISFNVRAEVSDLEGDFRIKLPSMLGYFGEVSDAARWPTSVESYFGNPVLVLHGTADGDSRSEALASVRASDHADVQMATSITRKDVSAVMAARLAAAEERGAAFSVEGSQELASAASAANLLLEEWRCLAAAVAMEIPGRAENYLGLSAASVIRLPAGFIQMGRTRQAADVVVCLRMLRGSALLWLFDPRPAVEVAAAADSIARRLHGRKTSLRLNAGDTAAAPGWLESALENRASHPAVLLILEYRPIEMRSMSVPTKIGKEYEIHN